MNEERSGVFKFRFDTLSSTLKSSRDEKKIFARLIKSLEPYKVRLILFVFVTLLYSVTFVLLPRLLGKILDLFSGEVISYMLGIGDNSVFRDMLPYGFFAVIIFLLNSAFAFFQSHLISGVITDYSLSLRSRVIDKFNRLSVKYIDNSDHRILLSKMTGDIDAIDQSLNIILMKYVSSLLLFVCVIIMQLSINFNLGVISLAFCGMSWAFTFLARKREEKNALRQQQTSFGLFDAAGEFYSGISAVQLSGKLKDVTEELLAMNRQVQKNTQKARADSATQSGVNELFSALCFSAVCIIGAFLIKDEFISIGILQCQLVYVRRLFSALSELSVVSGVKNTLTVSAGSIFDFMDITQTEKINNNPMPDEKEKSGIKFNNVTFRYSKDGENVLEKVSFSFPEKGITSLSGITGAGKTTVIKLMLGFYEPNEGQVLYKGVPVQMLPVKEYLSRFNIIIQGATLFDDTIFNNIAYGISQVDFSQVYQAARTVGANELIEGLPEGYDTVFNSSEPNLSEGEIQLILLARAFLRKKDIIIFDEATSGVDIMTEKKINKALNILAEESAVILIAHRNSATSGAKKRITISDGRAKEK